MIGDFRIMPRQTYRDENHTRWGFFIKNHPKGDPDRDGLYLCSWEDWDVALAAAHCLGVSPYEVQGIAYMVPSQ